MFKQYSKISPQEMTAIPNEISEILNEFLHFPLFFQLTKKKTALVSS